MKAGETLHFEIDGAKLQAVVRSEWFRGEHPSAKDRTNGMPWFDLSIWETERGSFVFRTRSRVRIDSGVARATGGAWKLYGSRDDAIDHLAEQARDGSALAQRALARLQAEEV